VETVTTPGKYCDGGGLWLKVDTHKRWVYRRMIGGKSIEMGLGSYPDVSLATARTEAEALRDSSNPKQTRRERRGNPGGITLRECMVECVNARKVAQTDRYTKDWYRVFRIYIYPVKDDYGTSVGELPIKSITTELVLKVLEPIWEKRPRMAARVQFMLSTVLDYGKVRHGLPENLARWVGHLSVLLRNPDDIQPVTHYRSLPIPSAPDFFLDLRGRLRSASSVLALLVLLTAVRKATARKAEWSEFDFPNRRWRIPAIRMKARRKVKYPNGIFDQPLSDTAVEILTEWRNYCPGKFVFPGRTLGTFVADRTLNNLLERLDSETSPHGLRATFRSWADTKTVCEPEVKKMALGHSVGSKTEEAYSREDWYEKRGILMDVWAEYLETGIDTPTIIGFREDARVILYRGAAPFILPGYKRRSERLLDLPQPVIDVTPANPPNRTRSSRAPASGVSRQGAPSRRTKRSSRKVA
jgi:integrase